MGKKKVVIGMSGGVDSSVAAYLLKQQGYDVIGVTMQTWEDNLHMNSIISDAEKISKMLHIPHHVIDFQQEFNQYVIHNFINEYQKGRTPNPCVVCNRYVKWESLLKKARELGAETIATGHYAQIEQLPNGRYCIKTSKTMAKDQSYVLYRLTQEQLKHTYMPIGEYTKEQVRDIARKICLEVSEKPDSQEICFIPDKDYAGYITEQMKALTEMEVIDKKEAEGNFVTVDGRILGKHKGVIHYTIGQRRGLDLAMGHRVFVTEIRPETNEVVIGEEEDLMTKRVYANQLNFMSVSDLEAKQRVMGKIRYNHKGALCQVQKVDADVIECIFDEPQRAAAPGQSLVLYDGDYVLGGGTILEMR